MVSAWYTSAGTGTDGSMAGGERQLFQLFDDEHSLIVECILVGRSPGHPVFCSQS